MSEEAGCTFQFSWTDGDTRSHLSHYKSHSSYFQILKFFYYSFSCFSSLLGYAVIAIPVPACQLSVCLTFWIKPLISLKGHLKLKSKYKTYLYYFILSFCIFPILLTLSCHIFFTVYLYLCILDDILSLCTQWHIWFMNYQSKRSLDSWPMAGYNHGRMYISRMKNSWLTLRFTVQVPYLIPLWKLYYGPSLFYTSRKLEALIAWFGKCVWLGLLSDYDIISFPVGDEEGLLMMMLINCTLFLPVLLLLVATHSVQLNRTDVRLIYWKGGVLHFPNVCMYIKWWRGCNVAPKIRKMMCAIKGI